jgi:GMP synthase (glutamine-hydrolysing)
MKPVLFVRNDSFETFGIAPSVFETEGIPVRVVNAIDGEELPAPGDACGIVMFGSSYNVDETDAYPFLKAIRDLTREALDEAVPYLGVCLGAQVLARALDRPVLKAPVREMGFVPIRPTPAAARDRLLSHYEDGDMVFQWHTDTFLLPEGGELLAEGDDVPLQAYRVGELAWGVQWHFEIDGPEIDLWLQDIGGPELEAAWGRSAEQVQSERALYLEEHEQQGRELFRCFADVVHEMGR